MTDIEIEIYMLLSASETDGDWQFFLCFLGSSTELSSCYRSLQFRRLCRERVTFGVSSDSSLGEGERNVWAITWPASQHLTLTFVYFLSNQSCTRNKNRARQRANLLFLSSHTSVNASARRILSNYKGFE